MRALCTLTRCAHTTFALPRGQLQPSPPPQEFARRATRQDLSDKFEHPDPSIMREDVDLEAPLNDQQRAVLLQADTVGQLSQVRVGPRETRGGERGKVAPLVEHGLPPGRHGSRHTFCVSAPGMVGGGQGEGSGAQTTPTLRTPSDPAPHSSGVAAAN